MSNIPHPPRLAEGLLRLFHTDRGEYTHLGDFAQVHRSLFEEKGYLTAWRWYWIQTIKTLPWLISNKIYWSWTMFKNYVKTALRNMFKNRGYSFINILGLAIGMAACLMIFLYVQDELSYDAHHKNGDRIFRLAVDYKIRDQEAKIASSSAPAAEVILQEIPEIENIVRLAPGGDKILQFGEKSFKEKRAVYTEPSFFDIFTVPLLDGSDASQALALPHHLLLSRKTAAKYFGSRDPVGRRIRLENREDFTVAGVFEDMPSNSHFHFDILLSLSTLEQSRSPSWITLNFPTYLLVKEGVDIQALEKKFEPLVLKYVGGQVAKLSGYPANLVFASGQLRFRYFLQPLRDIHLRSALQAELEPNGDIKFIYIFSAIALFILGVAAVNYMNLTTARAAGRTREVGMRKVLGSQRFQLIRQFLVEALFFSLLSMTLAILLVILLIPAFNQLSGKSLEGGDLFGWLTGGLVLLVALVTGIVSGIYPAFYLSSFRPVQVLKGQTVRGFRFSPLRRALVVFQFIASIVLLIGTTVVYTQLSFVQNKNLGYDKEQVLVLDNAYLLGDQAHAFKDKLLVNSEFVKGTVSGYLPVPSLRNFTSLFPEGDARSALAVQTWSVDEDYIDTLGMSLVDGRNFSKTFSTDGSAVIINRKAALDFGWDQPLGKKLTEIVDVQGDKMDYTVIGVVEDFHYESLRENIGPLVLFLKNSNTHIAFRILAGNAGKGVSKMEDQWRAFLPGQPFEYFFLDSRFGSLYRMERRFGEIIGIFALLSVFIGCLGLFGLASYSADRRTKEIGIRKVLGAGVPEIIRLLMKEFIVLVGLATLIAWPIAYVIMEGWLRDFSYRTSIGLWIFIGAGAAAFGVTFLTVGFQALKAAFADPIKSLRYE